MDRPPALKSIQNFSSQNDSFHFSPSQINQRNFLEVSKNQQKKIKLYQNNMECNKIEPSSESPNGDSLASSYNVSIDDQGVLPISDYIPKPQFDMMGKMEKFEGEMKNEVKKLPELITKPPYISSVYGQIRKTFYNELSEHIKGWPETKKNEQKSQFFKKVDLKYQKPFESKIRIRELYEDHIAQNNFQVSVFKLHHNLNLAVSSSIYYHG